jgi:hypothetical protein
MCNAKNSWQGEQQQEKRCTRSRVKTGAYGESGAGRSVNSSSCPEEGADKNLCGVCNDISRFLCRHLHGFLLRRDLLVSLWKQPPQTTSDKDAVRRSYQSIHNFIVRASAAVFRIVVLTRSYCDSFCRRERQRQSSHASTRVR